MRFTPKVFQSKRWFGRKCVRRILACHLLMMGAIYAQDVFADSEYADEFLDCKNSVTYEDRIVCDNSKVLAEHKNFYAVYKRVISLETMANPEEVRKMVSALLKVKLPMELGFSSPLPAETTATIFYHGLVGDLNSIASYDWRLPYVVRSKFKKFSGLCNELKDILNESRFFAPIYHDHALPEFPPESKFRKVAWRPASQPEVNEYYRGFRSVPQVNGPCGSIVASDLKLAGKLRKYLKENGEKCGRSSLLKTLNESSRYGSFDFFEDIFFYSGKLYSVSWHSSPSVKIYSLSWDGSRHEYDESVCWITTVNYKSN